MPDPAVVISLDDGTSTNVSRCPVNGWTYIAVLDALQKCELSFRDGVIKDEESIGGRLRKAIGNA